MSSWVILVDNLKDLSNTETPHKVMTVREYLTHPKLFTGAKPTILNLSRSYAYQGAGYYASLLAEARQHRVVPVVETMIELSRKQLYQHALPELEDRLNRCLRKMAPEAAGAVSRLLIYLGQVGDPALEPFARLLFDWFRAPVLEVLLEEGEWRSIKRIRVLAVNDLVAEERAQFLAAVESYTTRPGGRRNSAH